MLEAVLTEFSEEKVLEVQGEEGEDDGPKLPYGASWTEPMWRKLETWVWRRRQKPLNKSTPPRLPSQMPRGKRDGPLDHERRGLVGALQDWAEGSEADAIKLLAALIKRLGLEVSCRLVVVGSDVQSMWCLGLWRDHNGFDRGCCKCLSCPFASNTCAFNPLLVLLLCAHRMALARACLLMKSMRLRLTASLSTMFVMPFRLPSIARMSNNGWSMVCCSLVLQARRYMLDIAQELSVESQSASA